MSTIRIDDESIPLANTIVGLTLPGIQGGQTKRVPPALLKGSKGDDGTPLTYDDLTPTQIKALQKPAQDMIDEGNQVIADAQFEIGRVTNLNVLTSESVSDITEYNEVSI